MAQVTLTGPRPAAVTAETTATARRRRPPWRNPWRHAWFLEGFTWIYLIWSIVPIGLAVLFSFNAGKSQSVWQGFSLRWYLSDPTGSVLHSPVLHQAVIQTLRLSLLTTVIAVPLGVTFAIGVDRWRSRTSQVSIFVMIVSFVVPELIFGYALFAVFTQLYKGIQLGTWAEVLGLVVWNISWPAIIVRARLISIGKSYEEAAADLGASRLDAVRRVLVPLLMPAIFASAVLVFAGVIDDFVVVDLLSSGSSTQPVSVLIYATTRGGNNGPALNAVATIMLLVSLIVAILGYFGYRFMTRGERGASSHEALAQIGGL
jgi:spermidine/putrescine transport system permease protein